MFVAAKPVGQLWFMALIAEYRNHRTSRLGCSAKTFGWRPQGPLLFAALVFVSIHDGSSVPETLDPHSEPELGRTGSSSNDTWAASYAEVDAQATAQIHYAASALSNHSKKTLDHYLPKFQQAAKHYGW